MDRRKDKDGESISQLASRTGSALAPHPRRRDSKFIARTTDSERKGEHTISSVYRRVVRVDKVDDINLGVPRPGHEGRIK